MKAKTILLLTSIFCFGCIEKPGIAEFVTVVSDHNELCQETNDALIKSLESDIKRRIDSNTDKPEDIYVLNELIYRLELIKKQSYVINSWVKESNVTPELISEMIKSRWRRE